MISWLKNDIRQNRYFWLFLLLGCVFRLAVAPIHRIDHFTFDFRSYLIVIDILREGGNVYNETIRYNYSPLWSWVLYILDSVNSLLSGGNVIALRLLMVCLLMAGDIAIASLLRCRFGIAASCWFILNPISILVSGYQGQFENLAIWAALCGVLLLENYTKQDKRLLWWAGLGMICLSLLIKHIFFLFPLWLAFREKKRWRKIVMLMLPISVFLASFLPYLAGGYEGILQHVFLYPSINNAPFYNAFLPSILASIFTPKAFFMLVLICIGLFQPGRRPTEALLAYLMVLFVFSSAINFYYLVIPTLFISVYRNPIFHIYTAIATSYLLLNYFRMDAPTDMQPILESAFAGLREIIFPMAVLLVGLGVLWQTKIGGNLKTHIKQLHKG